MRECLDISSAPYNEDCAQVGHPDYAARARKECAVYISQLEREFGEPPATALLTTKANPHDFGTYYTVAVTFDENDEEGAAYAYKIEGSFPGEWDECARQELGLEEAA